MPVTLQVASHPAGKWRGASPAKSAEDLLKGCSSAEYQKAKRVLRTSFGNVSQSKIAPSANGLVRAAYAAYSWHLHLTIRPEDVWFTILSQLSFYINANAEALRPHFVAHNGQQEIEVSAVGNIQSVDIGQLAIEMTTEMDKFLVDPDLKKWIMPEFSTTVDEDRVIAAVLMMGTLQSYFSYSMMMTCGIPSVTLLGEKADWEKLRARLDKLALWGPESEQFGSLLKVVLDYFVRSFENPEDPNVTEFWSKIMHERAGSGISYLSGWMTAFCFWTPEGKSLFVPPSKEILESNWKRLLHVCELDDTLFHTLDSKDLQGAFVSVPVKVNDNGTTYKTKMMAGSVGIQLQNSRASSHDLHSKEESLVNAEKKSDNFDTVQPASGWWMYELKDGA